MVLFKKYANIIGFLKRFTIIKIGKLHIRIHKIVGEDATTLYHNHPFHYLSIILDGGYKERVLNKGLVEHKRGSFIFRNRKVFHRIEEILKPTTTLFIAWGKYPWHAFNTEQSPEEDGVFRTVVKGIEKWAKRENGIWFIGNEDINVAINETRHSIHQDR